MSQVMCHVSQFIFFYFLLDKAVKLVHGGSVINRLPRLVAVAPELSECCYPYVSAVASVSDVAPALEEYWGPDVSAVAPAALCYAGPGSR